MTNQVYKFMTFKMKDAGMKMTDEYMRDVFGVNIHTVMMRP